METAKLVASLNRSHQSKEMIPYAIVPQGFTAIPLEQFLPNPSRIREFYDAQGQEDFEKYVRRFYNAETTVVFREVRADCIRWRAVFDYHSASGLAGWKLHQAGYDQPIKERVKSLDLPSGIAIFGRKHVGEMPTVEDVNETQQPRVKQIR